jgi:hypothetical protein
VVRWVGFGLAVGVLVAVAALLILARAWPAA